MAATSRAHLTLSWSAQIEFRFAESESSGDQSPLKPTRIRNLLSPPGAENPEKSQCACRCLWDEEGVEGQLHNLCK